jgi:two-component system OmpR family response regulator
LKVAIIDDEETVLQIIDRRLQTMGHEVITRSSAIGASTWLMQERPDLVLVDLSMPALPGDEWLGLVTEDSLLKDSEYKPAFAVISGRSVEELERVVRETCAVGYIHKTERESGFELAFDKIVQAMNR